MGRIVRVTGPVVIADDMRGSEMHELVRVGEEGLIGEIIGLEGTRATVQVYEETSGIKPGERVEGTGKPLSVELGPGLVGAIYDGTQRPLTVIRSKTGDMITRGVSAYALPRDKRWEFVPKIKNGAEVVEGDVLGVVKESKIVEHRILVPLGINGRVIEIVDGAHKVEDVIATIETADGKRDVKMMQVWPVRRARPFKEKFDPSEPLLTGQRVADTFFPIAKGGTVAIPGGFGTGKCVTPNTPIMLADGQLKRVEDLFNELASEGTLINDGDESFVNAREEFGVISLTSQGLARRNASIAYKGKTDSIIRIKTRSGRIAEVTPAHRLFVFHPDLTVKEVPAALLSKGTYLVAPRRIRTDGKRKVLSPYEIFGPNIRCSDPQAIETMVQIIKNLHNKMTLKELAEKTGTNYDVLMGYYLKRNRPMLGFLSRLSKVSGEAIQTKFVKGGKRSKPIKIPEEVNEEFAEFLGLLLSDGMIKGKNAVYFFNDDTSLLDRFSKLCKALFNLDTKFGRERTVSHCWVSNTALAELLRNLGVPSHRKSNTCVVPAVVLASDDAVLAAFLNGYIAGDVSVSGHILEIGTSSKDMGISLSYALTRLGILHRLSKREKLGYYMISIEGREKLEKIHAMFSTKYRYPFLGKIENYLRSHKKSYESIDVVPLSSDILKWALRELGLTRGSLEKLGIFIKNYTELEEKPSDKTYKKIVDVMLKSGPAAVSKYAGFKKVADLLDDVFFDEIVEVTTINDSTPVYDITVPGEHNFVGGFGPLILHNTVFLHQVAKWADADIVTYVGCGERGNEMCDVLVHFPELKDPRSGESLMERTTLIANTSNMPVAAREASVYTGITIAEYFRDMGYDVALMADSTSRWAEAMREISGRLEEMPGEEGFPAYLASRLAEFYERAGRVRTLGSDERFGSVTVLGAVSPPGGDLSEPVSQNTLRIVKVFWALDTGLADRRHFPAIHWLTSYSLYIDNVREWWQQKLGEDWKSLRGETISMLQKEAELEEIVKLVGPDALPEPERAVLESARMMREDFLQQFAFHEVDTYCPVEKQLGMLKVALEFYRNSVEAAKRGVSVAEILRLPIKDEIAGMKRLPYEKFSKEIGKMERELRAQFDELMRTRKAPPTKKEGPPKEEVPREVGEGGK